MNMNRKFNDSAWNIENAASEWCVIMHDADVDLKTKKMFADWLSRSPEHISAFLEMARLWELSAHIDPADKIDVDAILKEADRDENIIAFRQNAPEQNPDIKRARTYRWMYVASCAVVVALMAVLFSFQGFHFFNDVKYVTGTGEQRSFVLSDHSVVYLNAESKLTVEMDDAERIVNLIRGEAYFDIAHDADRPFFVHSPEAVVRVVGTKFNVKRNREDTTVSVVDGKVSVKARNTMDYLPIPESALIKDGGEDKEISVVLEKGQQTRVSRDAVKLEPRLIDTAKITAWRERRLVFESEPLINVIEEFNRYNALSLKIEDKSIADIEISGSFNADSPGSLLDYLEQYEGVVVMNTDRRKYLLVVKKSR